MKKIIYILPLLVLICGCSKEVKDPIKEPINEPVQVKTKEELLIEFAKEYFVGEEYALVEENNFDLYEVPLRTVIFETDLDDSFKGCDEEKTNIKYFIYKDEINGMTSILTITLDCNDVSGAYKYSSLDNYANRLES